MANRSTQVRISTGVLRGLAFAGVVFAMGFAFGVARGLAGAWLKWTDRHFLVAEACEIVVIVVVAWRVCRSLRRALTRGQRVVMTCTTLLSLLVLEAGVGLWLREMSWREYLHHFATVRGVLSLLGYSLVAAACLGSGKRDADVNR